MMLYGFMLQLSVALATLLCGLVGGLAFTFAIVVMPGINSLDDRAFLRAFQVMDGGIQNNQPVFVLVWLGSIPAAFLAGVLCILFAPDLLSRALGGISAVLFLAGVQWPTKTINIPLNKEVKRMDLLSMNENELHMARARFEPTWVRWNSIRTVVALLSTVLWVVLAFRV